MPPIAEKWRAESHMSVRETRLWVAMRRQMRSA